MKVLLVNGSPHKNGCTHRALQEIQMQLKKEAIDSELYIAGKDQVNYNADYDVNAYAEVRPLPMAEIFRTGHCDTDERGVTCPAFALSALP